MLLAAVLTISIATQGNRTTISLPNFNLPAFNLFFEQLVNSEAGLHIDRQEIERTKANRSSIKKMMDDATAIKQIVQTYQDDVLGIVNEGTPKQIVALNTSLEKLKEGLDGSKILDRFSGKKHETKKAMPPDIAYCCDHDGAYLGVLLAAVKIPSFSFHALSAPARYNIAPVLWDRTDGIFFADASDPSRALVLTRPELKGKKLRKGDVIVAIQGEDKEWEPISTWADILAVSHEFEMDKDHVHLRVMRKGKIQEIAVTAVPSSIDDE